MPALFVFLLKVNIALLLFCAGYFLVLRRLTFYTLNRVYLVGAILFASIYPAINLDGFAQRHARLATSINVMVGSLQAPAKTLMKPIARPDYWHWGEAVFWAGVAFLTLRLLIQLFSLYQLYRRSTKATIFNHEVRLIDGEQGPFSFWKSIYVNPGKHSPTDLKAILLHEQVHVNDWHTLDILLAELSTIFYWFNPGIWLIKKAVRENIEFITDRKILSRGMDSRQYQYSLVNVSFSVPSNNIVNHFNLSTIKKRIIMMNAKKSSGLNLTRYALLVPLVLVCLLTFSFTNAELAKKSRSGYKNIKLTFAKTLTLNIDSNGVVTAHAVINNPAAVTHQPDTVKKQKRDSTKKVIFLNYTYAYSDTTKKRPFVINPQINQSDSLTIFVNGVKTANIQNIDPVDIQSINIQKSNTGGTGKATIYITTYGNRSAGPPARIYLGRAKTDTLAMKLFFDGVQVNRNDTSRAITSFRINGQNYPPNGQIPQNENVKMLLSHLEGITVAANGMVTRSDSAKIFNMPIRMGMAMNADINHFSDKLTIIDGKEATARDLKKLRASDIESINVKRGPVMQKQYGEKAKEGVVFITTKKSE